MKKEGKILKVNLSTKEISVETLPAEVFRRYMGGSALASYLLHRELKPGVDPLSEDNVLVFSTGILTGPPVAGTSRFTVAAKSPLTGGFGEAEAGGFWGPEFKKTGFDAALITGRSEKPVYLWVHDGEAEIKDASHLAGKVTGEVEKTIREELGDEKIMVAQNGPAGERLVSYACILNNSKHANGRTGLGAVMGSKKLRAIAARGNQLEVADNDKIKEVVKWLGANWKEYSLNMKRYGTPGVLASLDEMGILPTRNFRQGSFEGAEKISGETMADTILIDTEQCYACPISCKRVVKTDKVDPYYGGPEYETLGSLGSMCAVDDLEAIAKGNELCNKYGLDTISTGTTIAFAMECFENGIITTENTGGVELNFGNAEGMLKMIELINKREGIGEILARGTAQAAREFGSEAEKFAMNVKGQELPMHDPRGKASIALAYALSPTGADHMEATHDTVYADYGAALENMYPLGILEPQDNLALDAKKVRSFYYLENAWDMYNSVGMCDFVARPNGPLPLEMIVELVEGVTGWDTSLWELLKVGERGRNMARLFNIKEKFAAEDDVLPERLFQPLENGNLKGQAVDKDEFARAIELYYEMSGWDKDGVPTKAKLEELELEWIE